ncbi:MAG: hypothetical protein II919_04475 [Lachnospiraceae bacterium]|nr:hypothetical protein [Lachnospiraceae bacterium]
MRSTMKNSNDVQMALEYAVYMMIGDEFYKMKSISQWKEMSLLINYKEIKTTIQYELEDICIAYVKELKETIPQAVWKQAVLVKIVDSDSYLPEVRFIGRRYLLRVFCRYEGKKTKLDFELFKKTHACKK